MIRWKWRAFADLTGEELYRILALRQRVFVVEQECAYQDADGLDPHALHLLGCDPGGELVAYLRVVAPGHRYAEPSIGRVVTSPGIRRQGAGRALFAEGLRRAEETYPGSALRLSAQAYLEPFYASFGFSRVGEPYDEDGIPHVEMVRGPGGAAAGS